MKTQFTPIAKLPKLNHLQDTLTVVVLSFADFSKGSWKKILGADAQAKIEALVKRQTEPSKANSKLKLVGTSVNEQDLWLVILPEKLDMFYLLEFARDTLKEALSTGDKKLRLVFGTTKSSDRCAESFGAALSARIFNMPVYGKRKTDQKEWLLAEVELVGNSRAIMNPFDYGFATAQGSNLVRELGSIPSNFLNPELFGEKIFKAAKQENLTVKFLSNKELKKMGAGAFTAVDQGNPNSAGGIYQLTYTPKSAAKTSKSIKTIHLVGKGICFDTGGYDVKTDGHMITMKGDMQGAAVALATVMIASRLKLPYKISAFLAVTENHISPLAYKADDVIIALNGMSIEVVNTDAEGRMILADTLTLASKDKPDVVIDFATLTGSAVRAIGTKYSAGFTNRETWHESIRRAGQVSGERVWTFPFDETYTKALESKVADILQCLKGPGADHIMAAGFLAKFVNEGVSWVHIDLSAAENEQGLGHVDSFNTGFGVRWALEFIKSFKTR